MSDEPRNENVEGTPQNVKRKGWQLTRFGYEKPAIPGPGRPKLPKAVKERREMIRKELEEIAHEALPVLRQILSSSRAFDRDRIRALEVVLQHVVPKLEEQVDDGHDNPWVGLPPAQLATLIKVLSVPGTQEADPRSVGN